MQSTSHSSDEPQPVAADALPPSSRRRRWMILLSVTVIGVAFAYWNWLPKPELRDRVEDSGGKYFALRSNPMLQSFLMQLNGVAATNHIIRFAPGRVSDTWLRDNRIHLDALKSQQLTLKSPRVTDDGISQLASAKGMISLDASDSGITDLGVSQLSKLTNLSVLTLHNTRVSDESIIHFNQMKGLKWLLLAGTEVTDTGIAALTATALFGISIDAKQFSPVAAEAPVLSGKFVYMGLYDADAESIARLGAINVTQRLTIQGKRVSSDCFPVLKDLINNGAFRHLTLLDANLTEDKISQLKQLKSGTDVQSMTTFDMERITDRSTPISNDQLW